MSKKRKIKRKNPIGREALRDVQERAVPRPTQYASGKRKSKKRNGPHLDKLATFDDAEKVAERGSEKTRLKTRPRPGLEKLDDATKRASRRNEVSRSKKRSNHLLTAGDVTFNWKIVGSFSVVLVLALVYSLWPTLTWAELAWRTEPDYSHGYLILPLACILLWIRRDAFPGIRERSEPVGLLLIALSVVMRIAGRLLYMDFLDGYSLIPMIAGLVWFLCGLPALKWAAPAIGFLILLVPLPYRFETGLSWELQGVATSLSTGFLRILGLPAISEGHTIWVGENRLMVAEACSGMRIFVGMLALATFWAATVKRCWLDRFILLGVAIPLALLVNAIRITVTGVLYGWFSSETARQIIHDWSGFLMIPLAAAFLWGIKTYWEKLYRPIEVQTASESLRRNHGSLSATSNT